MINISLDEIEAVSARALEAHGAPSDVAASVADAVRTAEANGNRICGLYYLESYCQQLQSGRVLGDAEPVVTQDKSGAVRVDANFGFAQWAFAAGFETAVAAARSNGIVGYSIEHSHTCTSLGYFTEQFAKAGLLAIGATNSTKRVAPPGGSTPVLGTNPMAMAVPARDGGVAFQFDYSTSAVALGKITMANAAGESIPVGWAVDADGNDTTDPAEALRGSLISTGGYKGYGLGLMVELLASALTGSLPSTEIPPLKAPEGPHHDIGQFYIVIDPQAYAGDGFWDKVEALGEAVTAQEGARLPGANRGEPTEVELAPEVWDLANSLAG
jgi:(2R)-3-sulfolactate dehydrogenase (NADP+)